MKYKIKINKEACIGCGACTAVCSFFKMKNGKAHVDKEEVEKLTCQKEAEECCPVNAIKIQELK